MPGMAGGVMGRCRRGAVQVAFAPVRPVFEVGTVTSGAMLDIDFVFAPRLFGIVRIGV
jgi:hypothetical protein